MRSNFWQKHPALRLLLPLCAGIACKWWVQVNIFNTALVFSVAFVMALLYHLLPVKRKFFLIQLNGIVLHVLIFCLGLMLAWKADCRNSTWFGHHRVEKKILIARIDEPLSEKTNSYKAIASIQQVQHSRCTGKIIIYFKKDSSVAAEITAGSKIIFSKPPVPITNSGNPGAFDYRRYCYLQGITHQLYLTREDIVIMPGNDAGAAERFLIGTRNAIVTTIRKYIDEKKEQGLAEALLIGYKDDLDKSLVQAYSNTGVIHVIAISGLHLGIIYTILLVITRPLNRKKLYWSRFILIIAGMWTFSLLAGAQASVLRSAVMFSFVAAGTVLKKNSSVINTLALSAFLLLCWKPYWLWDVGFQLSYSAVLSIILFFKPVYHIFYFRNRLVDSIWKITSVTISAQALTVPLTLYYFHQFPILLLFTNLVAVPLSSVILIGEIILMAIGQIPEVAALAGDILSMLIRWMNSFIESTNRLPFVTWPHLSITVLQAAFLYLVVIGLCRWLIQKKNTGLLISCLGALCFLLLRTLSFSSAIQQKKLIVYNIPKTSAADMVYGRKTAFIGDSGLLKNEQAWRFNILPSRIIHRAKQVKTFHGDVRFSVKGKEILFLSSKKVPADLSGKPEVVVISKMTSFSILGKLPGIQLLVIDGSVPFRKAALWKKKCETLNISVHHVPEEGAFVMNF